MKQIHERIKDERIAKGLTEDELAERLGIKRSTYQYWEKKTPGVDKIMEVARAMDLPSNYFFINNDEKNQSGPPGKPVENEDILLKKLELGNINVTVADYINLQDKLIKTLMQEKEVSSKKMDVQITEVMRTIRVDNSEIKRGIEQLLLLRPGANAKE